MRPETAAGVGGFHQGAGRRFNRIVVRPIDVPAGASGSRSTTRFIAGERRGRAAQMARPHRNSGGHHPARIPDEDAIAVALIETIQRENLNPLEEARAFAKTTHQRIRADSSAGCGSGGPLPCWREQPGFACWTGTRGRRPRSRKREIEMACPGAVSAGNRKLRVEISVLIVKKAFRFEITEALCAAMQQSPASPVEEASPGDPNVNRLEQGAGG